MNRDRTFRWKVVQFQSEVGSRKSCDSPVRLFIGTALSPDPSGRNAPPHSDAIQKRPSRDGQPRSAATRTGQFGPVKIFGQIKFVKFENYPLNDVGDEWSVAERGSHIV